MDKEKGRGAGRREFGLALFAALGGVTVTITGCGGAGLASGPSPGDRVGSVATNHGHHAVITAAQLGSRDTVVLSIRGASTHDHALELTAAEVARIRDGLKVEKTCAGRSHQHVVRFN
jgi:hypothetical protein